MAERVHLAAGWGGEALQRVVLRQLQAERRRRTNQLVWDSGGPGFRPGSAVPVGNSHTSANFLQVPYTLSVSIEPRCPLPSTGGFGLLTP